MGWRNTHGGIGPRIWACLFVGSVLSLMYGIQIGFGFAGGLLAMQTMYSGMRY